MSWHQDLVGSASIPDGDVDKILDAVGAVSFDRAGPWSKQDWGWSAECDIVRHPETDDLYFCGAGFSVRTNLPQRFWVAAKTMGYDVMLGPRE